MTPYDQLKNPERQTITTQELSDQTVRDRRARRLADQVQEEHIEAIVRKNAELRIALTALTSLLVERGVVTEADVSRRVQELTPPPVPETEPNPFAEFRNF